MTLYLEQLWTVLINDFIAEINKIFEQNQKCYNEIKTSLTVLSENMNEIKSQVNAAVSITPSPPTLNERKMKESFTDVLLEQEQRKENLIIFGIPESKIINIKEKIEDYETRLKSITE
jgi:uncharacterized coiled-coil protein SlyX